MRITCDVIQDLMPSYVDGILSEDSQALVKEHMEACKECRKMLELMKEEQGKEQAQMRPSAASGARHRAGETENTGSSRTEKNPEKINNTQSADSSSGSYPDTHRCGSRLQPLVFRRKIHDPGK